MYRFHLRLFIMALVGVTSACSDTSSINPFGQSGTIAPDTTSSNGKAKTPSSIGSCSDSEACFPIDDTSIGGCVPTEVVKGASPLGTPGFRGAPCLGEGSCNGGLECMYFMGQVGVCQAPCRPGACDDASFCFPLDPEQAGNTSGACVPQDWPFEPAPGELYGDCWGDSTCMEGYCIEPADAFYWLDRPTCLSFCDAR